ncbi:alpha/beta fold hydrolase [Dyella sp.]|uniref:alpha/beta fold hydrolase n=1 Tax=Dyella sp. TaxID=1869338 RepID=UPI002ED581CB
MSTQPRIVAAGLEQEYRNVLARWPVPATQQRIATRAGETFVVSCGPEHAEPVVLLHGALTLAASWMFDASHWAQRYRVHAIDLPGEPGLSTPTSLPLIGDAHAQWLDDVLDGLQIANTSMVGISLGARMALDYAIQRPGRITRLALLCPSGIGRQKPFLLKALPWLLLGKRGAAHVRAMVMGPPRPIPAHAQPLMNLLENIRARVRPRPRKIPRFTDAQLHSVRASTLVIVGGRDAMLDSRHTALRIQRTMPRAQVKFIEDAYHYIPDQRETIFQFLGATEHPHVD